MFYNKFIFFLGIFFIQSHDKSPKILLNTSFCTNVSLLNYMHLKSGFIAKYSFFSYKLSIDKSLFQAGLFIELINVFELESFFISMQCILKPTSVQSLNFQGISATLSFRSWFFPINVGAVFFYFTKSPKFSIGLIVTGSYELFSRVDIGMDFVTAYILDKNVEGLIENKDFYSEFYQSLDSNVLKTMQNTRDQYRQHDAVFALYLDIINCKPSLIEKKKNLEEKCNQAKYDNYEDELELFNNELSKIIKLLEKRWIVMKNINQKNSIKFTETEIKSLLSSRKIIKKQIETETEKIDEAKSDEKAYNISNYLNLLIKQVLFDPVYMIEMPDKFLTEEESDKREEILKAEEDEE